MNRLVHIIIIAFTLSFWAAGHAEVTLTVDGRPGADIVVSGTATRTARLAAAELQHYLEKMSGAKLAIRTIPGNDVAAHIYVGKSTYTEALNLSDDALNYGAFRTVVGKDWLALLGQDREFQPRETYVREEGGRPKYFEKWDALTGGTWANPVERDQFNAALKISAYDGRGSLNAVYDFLRGLGVRWYYPGDIGEVVPHVTKVTAQPVDKTVVPDFAYRHLYIYYADFMRASAQDVMWQLRLGLNQDNGFEGGHGMVNVHIRDKSNREHFALYGGTRSVSEPYGLGFPCLSSESLQNSVVKYTEAVFKVYPDLPMVSLSPVDGYSSLCQCDLCSGKGTPERGWNGRLSDYVWSFENRVAAEVYKTHPEKQLSIAAYSAYQLPPAKIEKLSPNISVVLCRWRSGFDNPQARGDFASLTDAWLAKSPRELYTYDYYLHCRPGLPTEGVPVYFPHIISDDLRSLKGKTKGEFIEVYGKSKTDKSGWEPLAANHLNCYITSRFWWDVSQDVDAILAEYYEKFYGPAKAEMKNFVEYAEANGTKAITDVQVIDRLTALLKSAREKAGDSVYGKRIDLLATFMSPLLQKREQLSRRREDVPKARCYMRPDTEVKLDGKLDEPFWQGIAEYGLAELETGRAPAYGTTFKAVWAKDSLYIGIVCREAHKQKPIIGSIRNGDSAIFNGDTIELLLETQAHSYYQIAISPSGALINLDRKGGMNSLWSSQAQIAAHSGEGFWNLEIRLPVAGEGQEAVDPNNGVAGRMPTETYPWYFNVCRQRVRNQGTEFSAFSPTGKKNFHEVLKFGELFVK